jgi:hypothetical protein
MSRATREVVVEMAQAQGVKVIRPLGCGGFALLKAGRWFEFKNAAAMRRWLERDPQAAKEGRP